jgi:hypothetical protein
MKRAARQKVSVAGLTLSGPGFEWRDGEEHAEIACEKCGDLTRGPQGRFKAIRKLIEAML